jgi:hypothetical protein
MCELIETYQTLIAGSLGFLGVMATLWWNGHLQRKLEERRERREASALRTALIEELKQQREALRYTAESLVAAQAFRPALKRSSRLADNRRPAAAM